MLRIYSGSLVAEHLVPPVTFSLRNTIPHIVIIIRKARV